MRPARMRSLAPALVVVAYFTTVAALYPLTLTFDGLSFLMGARAGTIDYGHALYMPLLRAAGGVPGLAPERAAQLVSAAGATVAFVPLWRRAERGGVPRVLALLVATCFGLAPLAWQEAGAIEPTSWTIAALLAAAEAAEAYARRTSLARLGLFLGAFSAAVGFHLVSLCALPWLVSRAWKRGAPPPRAHLLLVLGAVALVLLAALAGGDLGLYLRYWSGFVPTFEGGVASALAWHLERGGKLALEGAPVLLALAAVVLVVLLRARVAVED